MRFLALAPAGGGGISVDGADYTIKTSTSLNHLFHDIGIRHEVTFSRDITVPFQVLYDSSWAADGITSLTALALQPSTRDCLACLQSGVLMTIQRAFAFAAAYKSSLVKLVALDIRHRPLRSPV